MTSRELRSLLKRPRYSLQLRLAKMLEGSSIFWHRLALRLIGRRAEADVPDEHLWLAIKLNKLGEMTLNALHATNRHQAEGIVWKMNGETIYLGNLRDFRMELLENLTRMPGDPGEPAGHPDNPVDHIQL
jgi:hypothetical protein